MKREQSGRTQADPLARERYLTMGSTAGLILLMLAYLVMTISSSVRLAEQTDIISNHPFEVVISAGDVKVCLSDMRIRTERLLRHSSGEDVEIVSGALDDLHASAEEPLSRIEELYLGEPGDVEKLRETMELLREEQTAFLDYVARPETLPEEIEIYEQGRLQPLYSRALEDTEKIIAVAQAKKVGYGRTADSLRRATLAGSAVLMTLMVGVLLISQYVLRRQRRELFYRSRLFDDLSLSIDDTFLIRDAGTGAISYCALNMERVLGASVKGGGPSYQGLRPEDAEEFGRVARDPNFISPFEKLVEYQKPGGEKRWLLIRVYRTEDMRTPQLITVFSDRTEEVLSRRALQDAMRKAERANSAKSDFLSRMSHEIRTPLNAIIGMTTIASASVRDPARVEDCLGKISFSSRHLLMLINDVLDMSKIESDKMLLQNEPFDIFQVINGFVSTVYAQSKEKQIDFQENMEGFGDHTVFVGDSLRLNQILLNLSSNAVKFTPPGGKIRLRVVRVASKSAVDLLRFEMSDTGIGMTEEAIGRIFQPFEQADASIAGRFGGTGLGMSITKNLVTLMNGSIRVTSEPGAGTTCTVELPFLRGTENVSEPDFENQGLRALVVDDERQVCEQTACLLEKIKIRTEWRQSGAEAVGRIRELRGSGGQFDICLIDWKMPGMDGIEAARRIRGEVGEEIPIVLISAYDGSEVEQEAREAGVSGFLAKPLYRSSVYAAIQEALEYRQGTAPSAGAGDARRPLAGKRLLVAEDNALNQEIAAELLRMNGAEVTCADDGRQALERFLASGPGGFDAILMDVQMPVMDGYEAARRIRTSGHPAAATIPIVATTAKAFSVDISAALASGMNAHVSKPLDIGQLCRVLSDCIWQSGQKQEEQGRGAETAESAGP